MLIEIAGVLFNLKFKVLSFSTTISSCDNKCTDIGGNLPYLHQAGVYNNESKLFFAKDVVPRFYPG